MQNVPNRYRLHGQQQKVVWVRACVFCGSVCGILRTDPNAARGYCVPRLSGLFPRIRCADDPACQSAPLTYSPDLLFSRRPSCVYPFSSLFTYFSTSSLLGRQTRGSATWWRWCWRSPCPRSPRGSVTCCCARLAFCWACWTATSSSEKSVHLMSTGKSCSSYSPSDFSIISYFFSIFNVYLP